MKKLLSSLVMTVLLSSCAVEKEKLTENIGKYVPPNIDDINFKRALIAVVEFGTLSLNKDIILLELLVVYSA